MSDRPARTGQTAPMETATPTALIVGSTDATSALRDRIAGETVDVVGTADADGLDEALAPGAVDVLVVVPGASELAAAATALRRSPGTRALAVTDGPTDPAALVDAGIGGVIASSAADTDLAAAVVGLARGEGTLDAALARHVLEAHADPERDPLSPTEEEVLGRLAAGESVEAIAEDYAVTPRLVRLHAGGPLARLLPS